MTKNIYLFLCSSQTYVSRAIRFSTADTYTHISLSFVDDLSVMYSFARKNIKYPLPAGFINENIHAGFFKLNYQMPCALYKIQVSEEAYGLAQAAIAEMALHSDDYRYNILGLFLCRMNISYRRERHYFCSQFVSEILTQSQALHLPKAPGLMHPADFTRLPEVECLFTGTVAQLQRLRQASVIEKSTARVGKSFVGPHVAV